MEAAFRASRLNLSFRRVDGSTRVGIPLVRIHDKDRQGTRVDQRFPPRLRNHRNGADGALGAGAALARVRRIGLDSVRKFVVLSKRSGGHRRL